jgi:hypothetical protein
MWYLVSSPSNQNPIFPIQKYANPKFPLPLQDAFRNMRGCRQRQKHQRSEPSIHFLIYGKAIYSVVLSFAFLYL